MVSWQDSKNLLLPKLIGTNKRGNNKNYRNTVLFIIFFYFFHLTCFKLPKTWYVGHILQNLRFLVWSIYSNSRLAEICACCARSLAFEHCQKRWCQNHITVLWYSWSSLIPKISSICTYFYLKLQSPSSLSPSRCSGQKLFWPPLSTESTMIPMTTPKHHSSDPLFQFPFLPHIIVMSGANNKNNYGQHCKRIVSKACVTVS